MLLNLLTPAGGQPLRDGGTPHSHIFRLTQRTWTCNARHTHTRKHGIFTQDKDYVVGFESDTSTNIRAKNLSSHRLFGIYLHIDGVPPRATDTLRRSCQTHTHTHTVLAHPCGNVSTHTHTHYTMTIRPECLCSHRNPAAMSPQANWNHENIRFNLSLLVERHHKCVHVCMYAAKTVFCMFSFVVVGRSVQKREHILCMYCINI